MGKPTISLCMIVRNEEEQLARCLRSVHDVVDEMIVVDTGSTDRTVEIARSFGARVICAAWNNDFSQARNIGLDHATGTWILFLDADEELEETQKEEIRRYSLHLEYEGFFLQVHNHAGNDKQSPTVTINPILRMFRNRPEHRFRGAIHEQIASSIVEARPGALFHVTPIRIHHYGYAPEWVSKKDKVGRNLQLLKAALQKDPDDPFHHYNIAVEYLRMYDYASALRHIREALRAVSPMASYAHLLYKHEARCLLALDRREEALRVLDRGIKRYPDYPDLYHMKGVVLIAAGRKREAAAALAQAVRIGPAPLTYHTEAGIGTYLSAYLLGQLCEEFEKDEEAIEWYWQAVAHNPNMSEPLQRIFRIARLNGKEAQLPRLLAARLGLESPTVRRRVVRLLLEEGCCDAALRLMARYANGEGADVDEDQESAALKARCEALAGKAAWSFGQDARERFDAASPEEKATAVQAAYLSGNRPLAWQLLGRWRELAPAGETPSAETFGDAAYDAYRRCITLTALADAHLARLDGAHPYGALVRRVRSMLPSFRPLKEALP